MNFSFLKNTKAISYTVGIHLVLLLLFFFVKYKSVALPPPPADELIELEAVALGTDDNGFGIEPPEMMMGMPAPPATPTGESSNDAGDISEGEANHAEVEQDNDEHEEVETVEHPTAAPVIKKSGKPTTPKPVVPVKKNNTIVKTDQPKNTTKTATQKNNTTTSTTKANATKSNQPQAKYTFDGANGTGGNGADENKAGARNRGNGTGDGMMGRPGGDPNSMNFTGGVSGRNIVARPDSKAEFRDGGSVRVQVWVNREGQITRYKILSAKNATIRSIAEQKIKGVRFNKKPDAAAEQNGILTLNFKAGSGK